MSEMETNVPVLGAEKDQEGASEQPSRQQKGKGKTSRQPSRDQLGALESKVDTLHGHIQEMEAKTSAELDQMDLRIQDLEERESVRGTIEGLLAEQSARVKAMLAEQQETLRAETRGAVGGLQEQVSTLQRQVSELFSKLNSTCADLALCKHAMASRLPTDSSVPSSSVSAATPAVATAPRLEINKPKTYAGQRNAKEIDGFLWGLEQYFAASGLDDDAARLRMTPTYLTDTAGLWWRRRTLEVDQGAVEPVRSWAEFTLELKKPFYPENAEYEARGRLRRLAHKGTVREYVREFQELLLEIPRLSDAEALFDFIDGLQPWARQELQRRGVQDLPSAIAAAESLQDYRRNDGGSSNQRGKKGNPRSSGGAKKQYASGEGSSKPNPNRGKSGQQHGGGRDQAKPKGCFLCGGSHMIRDCPNRNRLSALLTVADKEQGQVRHEVGLNALSILNAVQARDIVEGPRKGSMYVPIQVAGETVKALVDSACTGNLVRPEMANKLGLAIAKSNDYLKVPTMEAQPMVGKIVGVDVRVGDWAGPVDFNVVGLDDYELILGLDWMDQAKSKGSCGAFR